MDTYLALETTKKLYKSRILDKKRSTAFTIRFRIIITMLLLAEKVGFEPTRRFRALRDFESRLFGHLSTSPYSIFAMKLYHIYRGLSRKKYVEKAPLAFFANGAFYYSKSSISLNM